MRRVLRGLLEDTGIQVVAEAANGLEGIAQAQAVRPDVVLMDWRMPSWTAFRPPPGSASGSPRFRW
jgi:YesN/AraC family two-component response regulator